MEYTYYISGIEQNEDVFLNMLSNAGYSLEDIMNTDSWKLTGQDNRFYEVFIKED